MRDQQHVRRIVSGVSLIATAILGGASWVFWPTLTSDGREFITDTLAVGRTRMLTGNVLGIMSIALGIVAVMGLIHLLHDHPGAMGTIGGGVAIVGLAVVALAQGIGLTIGEMAFSDLGTTEKATAFDAIYKSGAMAIVYAGSALMTGGFVLLAAALARARVVPMVSAYLLGAFGVVQIVGFATLSSAIVIASFAVLAVALVPVGVAVLFETDEAWEHPPRFTGYRIAGANV